MLHAYSFLYMEKARDIFSEKNETIKLELIE